MFGMRQGRREAGPYILNVRKPGVADLNQAIGDIDAGTFIVHRDDEARPLDDRRHVRRVHLEVGHLLLADAVEDRSQRLQHLRVAVHAFGWQAYAASGGHHHRVPGPHEYGASVFSSLHPAIQRNNVIAAHGDRLQALTAYDDLTHGLLQFPAGLTSHGRKSRPNRRKCRDQGKNGFPDNRHGGPPARE